MNRLALILASWFGCGYSPFAPGTVGSLGALVVAWLVRDFASPWLWLAMGVALLLPGVWAATRTEIILGRTDPGLVVIDEVVGQWLALAGAASFNWKSALIAFLLFRAFDITKPFPIRRLEKLPAGWGIMMDDVAAGVLGALVLAVLGWFNLY